jgi:hypothetical protein
MFRCFILSLIVAATTIPTVGEELPCQRFAASAGRNYCMLTAATAQANGPAALDLYRRGLASARRGDADQAFGDFDKALELEPGLALAY